MDEPVPALVVADSSVLIVLVKTVKLDLLRALYGRITVPEVVWREVTDDRLRPGATEVLDRAWIDVAQPDAALAQAHETLVDPGEALRLGICIKGTLGVLVLAKRRGLLASVLPVLDDLARVGLFISAELRAATLRAATESERTT